jgi:hypothetical protein
MADIRIKDLGTTASVTASDDFMAVDGTTNGTRKLSAATPSFLTSVTTPSLTSPASTNLTLGTGTSGTAITLLSNGNIQVPSISVIANSAMAFNGNAGTTTPFVVRGATLTGLIGASLSSYKNGAGTRIHFTDDATYNLGIGTDGSGNFTINSENLGTAIGINRFQVAQGGTVSISSTTAGSANAGALVVQGGISAGNTGSAASYFGGAVSITGNVGFYGQAATAKPTGVAVTAAAIHAALVTLNLIAA